MNTDASEGMVIETPSIIVQDVPLTIVWEPDENTSFAVNVMSVKGWSACAEVGVPMPIEATPKIKTAKTEIPKIL